MTDAILFFFETKPQALELYRIFEQKVLEDIEDVHISVKKTQISFSNKYMFACVSMMPVRKAADRPKDFIVITFGLKYRKASPRIDIATEAQPNRWTHHVLISSPEEIDDELMGWVKEAAAFSASKR